MAALGPADPPDPNEFDDRDELIEVRTIDLHYLELYRKTLEEIAHSPEYMADGPCADDADSREVPIRCPRCLAREVLDS